MYLYYLRIIFTFLTLTLPWTYIHAYMLFILVPWTYTNAPREKRHTTVTRQAKMHLKVSVCSWDFWPIIHRFTEYSNFNYPIKLEMKSQLFQQRFFAKWRREEILIKFTTPMNQIFCKNWLPGKAVRWKNLVKKVILFSFVGRRIGFR